MHFEAFFEEWHKLLFKKDYKYVFGNLKKLSRSDGRSRHKRKQANK
jgi:hypothetical protein